MMSKKKDIVELLEKGTDVEEICANLEVSTSYVYRIKREMDESKGNSTETNETKNDPSDGVVVDSTGGDGSNVEGDKQNLETKEEGQSPDQTNKVGGVKKRKKSKKKSTEQKSTEQIEQKGGIKSWILNRKKTMLLILTSSILLVIMLLSSLKMPRKPQETAQEPQSRFPVIR